MAYFTTTTTGGTIRFHDESALSDLKHALVDARADVGSDYDVEKTPCTQEYIPSPTEFLQRHRIEIEFLSVGCLIRIGCKSIPFESVEDAMRELNFYVNNPYAAHKKWEKIFDK